jgi:drug/metabolite transporter (DMT)-like permease
VSALIVSVQPLLVAAFAGLSLGERVAPRRWAGLALGPLGVVLVPARKLGQGLGEAFGAPARVAALLGMTAGTLYQKRHCAGMDLRTGNVVQFAASGLATGLLALLVEDHRVVWSGEFVFALLWLVLVLSLGAISLLYVGRTSVGAGGTTRAEAVCFWQSNAYGTGATTTTRARRACAHDLAAGEFYHLDVLVQSRAGQTAQFLGVDVPP